MKKNIFILLAAIILSFTSCILTLPDDGGEDNPQPTPTQEQITIPSTVDVKPVVSPEGGDTKITFTAAAAWTASVINTKADSWVDVNPKSGNPGLAEIKITTTPNDTYVERNATIQIKCGTETKDVVLTQKQMDNITVTTDKVELGAEGGSFTIELKSNIDFNYEIEGDWIKYVSTKAYSDKTLTFSAEPNDGVQKREGSVTVKGGEFFETVKVYQNGKIYVPVTDMVDLGLSVKWATCNIGASKPEQYGGYYQWAGLQDVTSNDINLGFDNCPYHTSGTDYSTGWTKYVQSDKSSSWAGTGSPDNKTVLDPEDDIAHVTLGGKWRMPTDAEWTELRENCTWTWTDDYNGTGVAGRIVTSNQSGYTDKSIFLPAAGYRDEVSLISTGINGCYWSSSLESGRPYLAYWVLSYSSNVRRQNCYRFYGNSVRPVYVDNEKVTGVSLEPTSLTLNIGETYTISVTVTPSNAAEQGVSWTSSNTEVATVDQSGKVTAVKAGSTTITVRTTDGGYTATCSVTMKPSESVSDNIVFKDPVAKSACVAKYDTNGDGEVSIAEAEAVTSFSGLFTNFKTVKNFDEIKYFKNVHSISGLFNGCYKLESISIPQNIKDLGTYAFNFCYSLTSVTLPSNITAIGDFTFADCQVLSSIEIPSNVTYIGTYAFMNCYKLSSIRIPDKVTSIGQWAFNWCTSLTTINFPSGVTSIPDYCCHHCYNLTSINISEGVTSIGNDAFDEAHMWALKLPSSVTSLGDDCFGNIIHIILPATTPVSIKSDFFNNLGGKIFVPADMIEIYKGMKYWSDYWSRCRILPISSFKEKDAFAFAAGGAVDMGGSVKWAACNLGAFKPEDFGGYYQWAGTQDVSSISSYLDWDNCPYHTGSDNHTGWTKYVSSEAYGFSLLYNWSGNPDNKTVLDPEDDVANVMLGGNWRMPTREEFDELNSCYWEQTYYNEILGRMVYSFETGNRIFFPYTGREIDEGQWGYYWSSSCFVEFPNQAYGIYMEPAGYSAPFRIPRYKGCSVRPVTE